MLNLFNFVPRRKMKVRHEVNRRRIRPALEPLEDRRLMSVAPHYGPLLQNVEVETICLGNTWRTDAALIQQSQDLNQFFTTITNSTYMDMLSEYDVGRGSFVQADFISDSRTFLTEDDIRAMLDSQIGDPNSTVTAPDANKVYFVFTAPGVTVQTAQDNNDLAYHWSFTDSRGAAVYYAVVPNPSNNPIYAGVNVFSNLSAFDQLTEVSSHELAEAVTDPDTATGWFDDAKGASSGEIGDLANLQFGRLDGYVVQAEWSNAQQAAVLPNDATWLQWDGMDNGTTGVTSVASESQPTPANLQLVANALSHSDEAYSQFITAAYERYLNRAPDGAGLAHWLSAMRYGLSDERLEAGFIGSPEYIANHGGSGAGWVVGMYQDLLGRTPSDGEVASWVDALDHGMSTEAVAYGFAASAEREGLRVQADYQKYLGRQAAPQEVAYWVNAFEDGLSNEEVIAGFVGSPENFHNHGDNVDLWLQAAYQDILGRDADVNGFESWRQVL
jgi:hypothetical protein